MARKSDTLGRYDLTHGSRGKYLEKARRSFETIVVDEKVAAALGGCEGVVAVLEALAKSVARAKRNGLQRSPGPEDGTPRGRGLASLGQFG